MEGFPNAWTTITPHCTVQRDANGAGTNGKEKVGKSAGGRESGETRSRETLNLKSSGETGAYDTQQGSEFLGLLAISGRKEEVTARRFSEGQVRGR